MIRIETDVLGELSDSIVEPEEDLGVKDSESLNLVEYDPKFQGHDGTLNEMLEKKRCRSCGKRTVVAATLDGLCLNCAEKKMRELEEGLIRFKVIKEPHKYCCVPGHGLIAKELPEHKDWCGEIVVNGIHYYPMYPLCQDCLDIMDAWFTHFLEERGFMRKGSGNVTNEFGIPYKQPYSTAVKEESLRRLRDFMNAAYIYVLNREEPINQTYKDLKTRRHDLLYRESKLNAPETNPEARTEE